MKKFLLFAIGVFFTFSGIATAATVDCNIFGEGTVNGVHSYDCYVGEMQDDVVFSFLSGEFGLPEGLMEYSEKAAFKLTYDDGTTNVTDVKLYNISTGEIITDTSEENLRRLFDVSYGSTITNRQWSDKIELSSMTEGAIYRYTATGTVQFPEIVNDLGKNVMIYLKERDDGGYDEEICPMKKLKSQAITTSYNEYTNGEAFNIMYKSLSNADFLAAVDTTDVVKLSPYNEGDTLVYQFEKYLYNDTNQDIKLTLYTTFAGNNPKYEVVTIPKNTIYAFDWMIDSITVGDTTNNGGNGNNTGNTGNTGDTGNTSNTENNPNTGASISIVSITFVIIISALLLFVAERKKSIKRI